MAKYTDLTGRKFGRLTVIKRASPTGERNTKWHCICECGNSTISWAMGLRCGGTKSCGCLSAEKASARIHKLISARTTHNMTHSGTYKSWQMMKARCSCPNYTQFKDYGGRGITVCDRWLKFENFLEDMGERPAGRTLDRINNDGNYEPSNCRWATRAEQNGNKRKKRR